MGLQDSDVREDTLYKFSTDFSLQDVPHIKQYDMTLSNPILCNNLDVIPSRTRVDLKAPLFLIEILVIAGLAHTRCPVCVPLTRIPLPVDMMHVKTFIPAMCN